MKAYNSIKLSDLPIQPRNIRKSKTSAIEELTKIIGNKSQLERRILIDDLLKSFGRKYG